MKQLLIQVGALFLCLTFHQKLTAQDIKPPIMGWSSWNHFRIHIDEQMIREQADAMITSGMADAGYHFINIDDGFFGGRDSLGYLYCDSAKFPSGMKALADYIHSKGLKAGIYSEAGRNTCGFYYDDDEKGEGAGMYAHLEEDLEFFFDQCGYDFLKVDWCGGKRMNLDEETEYTKIIEAVRALDKDIVFNICRWEFPGEWAIDMADSWRISSDIRPEFRSIIRIIDINADLAKYASPGHYNDMDMLQVGRGMTYEEDKTHFSMWCLMNSPLLAGNDLRDMSDQTLEILTNKEIIALNQDKGFRQAERVLVQGEVELWVKPLGTEGQSRAIAIMNRSESTQSFELKPDMAGLNKTEKLRDLWQHKDIGAIKKGQTFEVPAHGVVVLKTIH